VQGCIHAADRIVSPAQIGGERAEVDQARQADDQAFVLRADRTHGRAFDAALRRDRVAEAGDPVIGRDEEDRAVDAVLPEPAADLAGEFVLGRAAGDGAQAIAEYPRGLPAELAGALDFNGSEAVAEGRDLIGGMVARDSRGPGAKFIKDGARHALSAL
jgi:hypothetical protein